MIGKKKGTITLTTKRIISASHHLDLPYISKCEHPHGHNWTVIVKIECPIDCLTEYGMVIDFTEIKSIIDTLDHKNLNEILPDNPTAENIAIYLLHQINNRLKEINPKAKITEITIHETEDNLITLKP